MVPAASTAAEGSADVRRFAATWWSVIVDIVVAAFQLVPPLIEVKANMSDPVVFSMGTTTVPFGWTTGWPPMPVARSAVLLAADQVRPPSVEVLIQIRSRLLVSSHST